MSDSNPGECVTLSAELAAHKEKLQREAITLWDGKDPRSEVRIVLQGRVLGEWAIPNGFGCVNSQIFHAN